MYLRETKRKNGDGSIARYYQLAENEWDKTKGCAVAKVVYNFGRADGLDGEKLKRLAKSILRLFPSEEALASEELTKNCPARQFHEALLLLVFRAATARSARQPALSVK